MTSLLSSFSPIFDVKLEFIGSKARSVPGAVVYPSSSGEYISLSAAAGTSEGKGRGKKCRTHLFLCREKTGGKGESKRDRERGSDVVKAWKMDPYVWRTV